MELDIFLSNDDFNCLIKFVPEASKAYNALKHPVDLNDKSNLPAGDIAIKCDATDARVLLTYAQFNCPNAARKIRDAFWKVKIPP
jgi:hypothetical protein